MTAPIVLPLGQAAFTIRLGDVASIDSSRHAVALAEALLGEHLDEVTEIVPAVASVAVFYADGVSLAERRSQLEDAVARSLSHPSAPAHTTLHTIPTRYDGADLDEVAERVGLSRDEVIHRHSQREYHVLSLGFLPGWAYLGEIDPALALPRRTTPRTRIPAGAVAIMGAQTGIYPRVSPGGWNLIGTTDVVLFDVERETPALFRAGDRVQFTVIA